MADTYQKDFAIAHNRMICLKGGQYIINIQCTGVGNNYSGYLQLYWNGVATATTRGHAALERPVLHSQSILDLKRGDYLQWKTTISIKMDGGLSTFWEARKLD